MRSWRVLLGTITEPVKAFRALAETPRSMLVLLVLMAAQLTVPLALSTRIDARPATLADLAKSGKLDDTSDRALDEAVVQTSKQSLAALAGKAIVGPPLLALELTLVLWLWSRFLYGKPRFGVLYGLAAHAQLPLGLRSLATALVILRQRSVEPAAVDSLLPSSLSSLWTPQSAALGHALAGADFFRIWTAVLLGVALYVAASFTPRRAAVGMGLAYVAFVAVFLVGLPGLGGA